MNLSTSSILPIRNWRPGGHAGKRNGRRSDSEANEPLGRLGSLETRLAAGSGDVRAAQALRYQVFYREMGARPNLLCRMTGRDFDSWDRFCDHLIVTDRSQAKLPVVATYRMLRASVARRCGIALYTQSEFDIAPVMARFPGLEFMELGRSCVLPGWRTKRTIELLWHGSWSYVRRNSVDVMLGCASFPGADPDAHRMALSFLRHHAAPEPEWDIRAVAGRAAPVSLLPEGETDMKTALAEMPPLIKGYLRLGAWIGRDIVVDEKFGTTDVLIILPVNRLNPRYVNYYGADAQRHSTG